MDFDETRKEYEKAAVRHLKGYSNKYGVPSSHIIDIVVSIMMTRDEIMSGGSFVQAVCDNNLRLALGRADRETINWISPIAWAYEFAHVNE